jgi:hypothetical protein
MMLQFFSEVADGGRLAITSDDRSLEVEGINLCDVLRKQQFDFYRRAAS